MEFVFASESARVLHAAFEEKFPAFSAYLASDAAFVDNEGRLSYAGLWADLSHWLRNDATVPPERCLEWLGLHVSVCYGSDDSEISAAVATCFLENIAGEPAGARLAPYLSVEAGSYMSKWCAAS